LTEFAAAQNFYQSGNNAVSPIKNVKRPTKPVWASMCCSAQGGAFYCWCFGQDGGATVFHDHFEKSIEAKVMNPFGFISDILRLFIVHAPGAAGTWIRYRYYKKKLKFCGRNVVVSEGVMIQDPGSISLDDNVWIDKYCILIAGPVSIDENKLHSKENSHFIGIKGELSIGKNVHVAPFCIIQAHGGVSIGDNSGLSSGVKIYSLSNLPTNPSQPEDMVYFTPLHARSMYLTGPVTLGSNVGVGLNSVILPSVAISDDSFVVTSSVVMSSFDANSTISGSPARRKSDRFMDRI
jgi:galactoside O-acetyltransferase